MSIIHRLPLQPRKNPLWLTELARRIGQYRRLRRTGLHRRASFWCAWNLR